MNKKNLRKTKKAKAISAHPKVRRSSPRLVHRDRKDLELKDYLMEDHPELNVPPEVARSAKTDRVSKVANH
jgi:hypothetical protein